MFVGIPSILDCRNRSSVETVQFNQYHVSEEKLRGKKPEEDKAGSPPSPLPSI